MKPTVSTILEELLDRYTQLSVCRAQIQQAFELLKECYQNNHKLLLCGNGGSAADCEHIVGELLKGFRLKRQLPQEHNQRLTDAFDNGEFLADHLQRALPAISLVGQISLNSAFINDVAAELVFAQGVYGLGDAGDVVIGISTSGNSKNVVNAFKVAKAFQMKTIGFTGSLGGEMRSLSDVCLSVPESETYLVQEYHLPVYHALCAMLEEEFFGS